MKFTLSLLFILVAGIVSAQKNTPPTDAVAISGKVKQEYTFSLTNSAGFSTIAIDSIVIYNHLMEPKRTIRKIKGILLTDILSKAGLAEDKPKLFSEFYFTCIGADGYKVVFSWNELYNTEVGKKVILVTEEDGKPVSVSPNRISVLSASDKATGRRFVHNLQTIEVERVR